MVFVKHQVQEINGTQYEYYYLYESYYEPGMKYPQNFKVGKVGEDVSSLVSSYKEKAKSNGIDLSESDLDHFRIQIRTVEEKAEQKDIDDEDKGEFYQDVFNEDAEEEENIDPEGLDVWTLETSSYGEEDGKWVWHAESVYVSYDESGNSVISQVGSKNPYLNEIEAEFESWEEVVEWLKDKEPEDFHREGSDKDPREMDYVYESRNRPVPSSFLNNAPGSIEISFQDRLVGSSEALPYDIFEEYELTLDEKNVEDTWGLKELVKWTDTDRDTLVNAFEGGRIEEVKQHINNKLYENNFDNQYLTLRVFDSVKEDVEDISSFGSERETISVKVVPTDEFRRLNDDIRKNFWSPGEKLPDGISKHDFEKAINTEYLGLRDLTDYIPLDPEESLEVGEVYIKDGGITGVQIKKELIESHIPTVDQMDVHEVVENMRVEGNNKEIKREFAKNVLNIVKKFGLGSDVDGRRIWKHLRVSANTKNDAYAGVELRGSNVLGIRLNISKYKNAPEKKKREIEYHEAVHFEHDNHFESFYDRLIEIISEDYGSIDQFRRFIATDIRASDSSLEPEQFLPDYSEQVFDWQIKKLASRYSTMMSSIERYSDIQRFENYGDTVHWEETGGIVQIKLGRGRGKSRLVIAEIDRIDGDISVKEPELWVYIEKVDMTDGSVVFGDASDSFQEAFEDYEYGMRNISDLRTYSYNSGDSSDRSPLALKVRKALRSYYKKHDRDPEFKVDGNKVRHKSSSDQVAILSVKDGDVIVEEGIFSSGEIPIAVKQSNGNVTNRRFTGRVGVKDFIQALEDGEDVLEIAEEQSGQWNEYSDKKPEGIDIIGIREDEKEKYYKMINSVKARVPDQKFDQLEEIKFTSDINFRRGSTNTAIGLYKNGAIKIDKDKPTLTQYYVIAHEIGHLIEDDTDNAGSERLMGKKYLRSGVSYVLKDQDREVLDKFKDRIEEQVEIDDLSLLPEHGQDELTWLINPRRAYGKREQSKDNYNYKEVFARAFAVWIVNEKEFRRYFPGMADYLDDFVENRDTWSEEYGVDL
jgi:hypothetical protein